MNSDVPAAVAVVATKENVRPVLAERNNKENVRPNSAKTQKSTVDITR